MKGLATILRETTIHKIEGDLIRYQGDMLVGKCAMGVISCEVGLTLDKYNQAYSAEQILLKAGLTDEQINEEFPFIRFDDYRIEDDKYQESETSLSYIIFNYNDSLLLTFKEIADYIETTFPEEDWAK